MAGPETVIKQSISVDIGDDGVSATHPVVVDFRHHVGPSSAGDTSRNTIKEFLVVVGCATVPDAHFDFDSSFVRPEAQEQFIRLAKLRDDLAEPIGPPSDPATPAAMVGLGSAATPAPATAIPAPASPARASAASSPAR